MYHFAQTNIQLFNQLHDLGYDEKDLDIVTRSYELAITLFTGQFRGSGKTFIAHLVGTASILASLRSAPSIIAAGLLHAAYESGDFGIGGEGFSPSKRDYLRAAVGAEVEERITRYTELEWNHEVAQRLFHKMDSLSRIEQDILLLRLANELEDYLDLGILFCGIEKRAHVDERNCNKKVLYDIARALGYPELAEALRAEIEKTAVASEQQRFKTFGSRNFSFRSPPLSYKRLMDVLAQADRRDTE